MDAAQPSAVKRCTPAEVKALFSAGHEFAFLDVREIVAHGGGHPLRANVLPSSRLEIDIGRLVPRPATPIVLLDGGEGTAERAAVRLGELGYTDVRVLAGGVEAWAGAGQELFVDIQVLAKGFSAFVEHHLGVPFIEPAELKARIDSGADVVVLDSRPLPEYRAGHIPGAIDCPGPELVRRFADLAARPETEIVVNCMSRTRGILGTLSVIGAGVPNRVRALRDGTHGWRLAGFPLEIGNERLPPPLSASALDAARARARAMVKRFAIRELDAAGLAAWRADSTRTTYVVDLRDPADFEADRVAGAVNAPFGGALMHPEDFGLTQGARMALLDDDGVRATVTAAWLMQLGVADVAVAAEQQRIAPRMAGPAPARPPIPPRLAPALALGAFKEALGRGEALVVDLGPSDAYAAGHIPGARWAIRAYLADLLHKLPAQPPMIVLTAPETALAQWAAFDLAAVTERPIVVFPGGTPAWRADGGAVEAGTARMACPPDDRWLRSSERPGDRDTNVRAYLAWEGGLLAQIERGGDAPYRALGR